MFVLFSFGCDMFGVFDDVVFVNRFLFFVLRLVGLMKVVICSELIWIVLFEFGCVIDMMLFLLIVSDCVFCGMVIVGSIW